MKLRYYCLSIPEDVWLAIIIISMLTWVVVNHCLHPSFNSYHCAFLILLNDAVILELDSDCLIFIYCDSKLVLESCSI